MAPSKPDDQEMIKVISDFLEQGLVDNIVSMFKVDAGYYPLIGEILKDERFAVRMGVVLLFEELVAAGMESVVLAVPVLKALISKETPAYIRGEAVTVLGVIGTKESLALLAPLVDDDDPQVAEIASDFIA